jgi:type I restriction enzyme M protein
MASFSENLDSIGILDPFQVRGIVAGFWYQSKFDFLTLMARDSRGVVDAWRTSIITGMEDRSTREDPLEHKLVKFIMGDFVESLKSLDSRKVELESQIKAATLPDEEDVLEGGANETEEENTVDESQLKTWKKELVLIKRKIKIQKDNFSIHLNKAVDGLSSVESSILLLKILHHDMRTILERYMRAQQIIIIEEFENWWDKYKVTLDEIRIGRESANRELEQFLERLGYVT